MAGPNLVNWAVIPAAGLGTRMAENAVLGCKELVEINGKSMLEHTIQELEKAGIEKIVVVSSPNKPAIDDALLGRGVEITHQAEPNGLIDAIKSARHITGKEPCLIALPDVMYTNVNPSKVLLSEYSGDTLLTVVNVEMPWGKQLSDTGRIIKIDKTKIVEISDKNPEKPFPIGEFRITGRAIWNDDFWNYENGNEVSTLRTLASMGKLSASIVKTEYIDLGQSIGYQYAQTIFNR